MAGFASVRLRLFSSPARIGAPERTTRSRRRHDLQGDRRGPRAPAYHAALGDALSASGRPEEALASYRQPRPRDWDAVLAAT